MATLAFELLGWPEEGPTLRLDHRRFSYAGKFVMSNTGKAIAREPESGRVDADGTTSEGVLAAISFNEDRTDPATAWIRYVTVRLDRRGEGIGSRLAAFATTRLHERGYERVRIAVNNPFAYEALHRAGFGYADERTGLAELVLVHPPGDRRRERYPEGLAAYREREELSSAEREFVDAHVDGGPPPVVEAPDGRE